MNHAHDEEKDAMMFDRIASALENNMNIIPPDHDFILLANFVLNKTVYDRLIVSILKCVTVYIKRGVQFCYEIVNKGIYNKTLQLYNPNDNTPKVSLEVATAARHLLMTFFSFDEMMYFRLDEFNYGFFIDKIFDFPLFEQKKFVEFIKNISPRFCNDKSAFSLTKVSQILLHPDIQIVSDCVTIIFNCFNRGTSKLLKIVDPIISNYLTISLYSINQSSLILILLKTLCKMCEISYEYAENLVNIPIDFGLIIKKFDDPSVEFVEIIMKIIKQIFSFSTLRKGDDRNRKISNFAFYVQPLLIQFIKQNLGDLNLALECLLTTFDVYLPLSDVNEILDAAIFSISSNKSKIKSIEMFYKKLIQTQSIQNAMTQYENLNISKKSVINHITDFNSFIEASNLHPSSIALSETLQSSILKFLRSIKSLEQLKKSFSIENFELFKESLFKIVNACQKNIIFNTAKPKRKTEKQLQSEVQTKIQLTLFDQFGKTLFLEISSALNFTICESFANYMLSNNSQWRFTQLGNEIFTICRMYLLMNGAINLIKFDSIGNDAKVAAIVHSLCFESNKRIKERIEGYFKLFYFKSQGKIFSPFDNIYPAFLMSKNGQIELIEIENNEINLTGDDLMKREDIIHKYKNDEKIIKSDEFHISFIRAYPILNLQKRAFNYYKKVTVPSIEKSLQIMKEIHRILPINKDCNIFENEIFGLRLLESLNFQTVFAESSIASSTFINFPYLFPFELRKMFLKLTALSVYQSSFTLIDEIYIKDKKPLNVKQQITINIDKEKIFEEGLIVFNLLSAGSLFYDVRFKNECGFGNGPTQEFFLLFSLEMQRNKLDIWLSDTYDDKNGYANRKGEKGLFPSPCAVHRPDLFFTLGCLCAKAIEMNYVLPFHFSPAFFKLIRGERIELEEVSSFYARSIENKSSLIGFPFTLPGRKDIELRNGGEILITDDGNIDLYIDLLKHVLTFDVFWNNKDDEFFEKTDFSPLTPTSSSAWRNLHRTNSSTNEDGISSPSSSSSNAKIRRVDQANIHTSSQTLVRTSLSHISSANINNNHNENESESIILDGEENNNNEETDENTVDGENDVPHEIHNYIERYSFECCSSMFKEGFGRIIPWNSMNIFTPDEICIMIEGV